MISSSNCSACHDIIAQGSGTGLEKLVGTGLEFEHPAGDVAGLACNLCHNGSNQE
jgi:hypothetical protein